MEERIVLYAAAGIGHIVSMVQLAKHLALRHHSITILLTTGFLDHPSIDAYIHRISTSNPSISFHRFPHLDLDPAPTATLSLPARAFHFIRNNVPNVTSALTLISKTSTIKAFVIDLFCTSAMDAASCMGIPVYYFFTSGAAMLSLYTYFPVIHEQTEKSLKDLKVELRVPGMTAGVMAWEMPEPLLDREDPCYIEMLYFCSELPRSSGILVNTFRELEENAVKAIEEGLCFPDQKQRPPVYYIGPFIADPAHHQSPEQTKECLSWLDKQPSKSVVYLCFGSRGSFSVEQLREIAQALEHSGQRFLWVVKSPPLRPGTNQLLDDHHHFDPISVLPTGFAHRTKDRGMVVASWAPQVEVLTRESVGAFVTHCGWNSVLEAVVAGVPMIAWPLYAEQHVNRNVLVEDMKVAVAVDQTGGLVSAEEL